MKKVYSRIEAIRGNVIAVRAGDVRYGELAAITTRFGVSLAEVIRLRDDLVSLQVFAGGRGISTGDEVRFLGHPMRVSFSDDLLGRVFNGSGAPRDKGPALTENLIPIGGPSVNPAKRIIPREMIRTGIPMIDLFNSLVKSQKLPDLLGGGRALQRPPGPDRHAGRGRPHHPRRHGPQARRLPLLQEHSSRRAGP